MVEQNGLRWSNMGCSITCISTYIINDSIYILINSIYFHRHAISMGFKRLLRGFLEEYMGGGNLGDVAYFSHIERIS